ncbi:hypothetical protein GQ53DRAFT_774288 [Thozetella sp. PMI_491]|nr:hypothetical protein GQ53DRAFT_774288 [Thozetella sp. PMI_491]
MPWAIPIALIIVWGVVWMFNGVSSPWQPQSLQEVEEFDWGSFDWPEDIGQQDLEGGQPGQSSGYHEWVTMSLPQELPGPSPRYKKYGANCLRYNKKGWSRKDNYERHMRTVHGPAATPRRLQCLSDSNELENEAEPSTADRGKKLKTRESEDELMDLSREELVERLKEEMTKSCEEKEKREKLEEEIRTIRRRNEEREDMLLKLLARTNHVQ